MILDPNPNPFPPAWAVAWGEDSFGLWLAFEIGGVRQVMRWIVPGRFEMGSPEDEPERWAEMETQHQVTITRGYWLADTACTQELWQAVMGENPARFNEDPQNPVERVSWNECQRFLEQANKQLQEGPGLRLPTEAQWEYACRAGSKGPFSWGDTLSTEQANYNGGYPYNNGPKGEYRNRTVPVLSFEPNPWGLYQMHGNVWEWCADWRDAYPPEPAVDPTGPAEGHQRVLRGGGWIVSGRLLRSAFRFGVEPDLRDDLTGLRLAGG
ncbi:MAG: formylglycine-generating enzyme family protein [Chromatiales bacterium]|nr:formylglycine-generating enzyme family protein [Chromatiales bacterium]